MLDGSPWGWRLFEVIFDSGGGSCDCAPFDNLKLYRRFNYQRAPYCVEIGVASRSIRRTFPELSSDLRGTSVSFR